MKKTTGEEGEMSEHKAAIVQGSLKLASGSGITIGGFLAAVSVDMVSEGTARFAIVVFASITAAALCVASAFTLRGK